MLTFFFIPAPPAIFKAPVAIDVESVVVFIEISPKAFIDNEFGSVNDPILPLFGISRLAEIVFVPVNANGPDVLLVLLVVFNTNLSNCSSQPINTDDSLPRLIKIPLSFSGVPVAPLDKPIRLSLISIFVVLTVVVVPDIIKFPVTFISSPTNKLLSIPTPPVTFNAPVSDDVLFVTF